MDCPLFGHFFATIWTPRALRGLLPQVIAHSASPYCHCPLPHDGPITWCSSGYKHTHTHALCLCCFSFLPLGPWSVVTDRRDFWPSGVIIGTFYSSYQRRCLRLLPPCLPLGLLVNVVLKLSWARAHARWRHHVSIRPVMSDASQMVSTFKPVSLALQPPVDL